MPGDGVIRYNTLMRTIYRDIVGGFIFSADGKLLLGKNRVGGVYEGAFVVPGGGVDPGETKEQALHREMREETGLDITQAKLRLVNESFGEHEKTLRTTGERVLVKMHFYNYRIDLTENAAAVKVIADDDWSQPQWFSLAELATIPLSTPTRRTVVICGTAEAETAKEQP